MLHELFITSRADWRNDALCRGFGGIDVDVAEAFFPLATATFNANGEHSETFTKQAQAALNMCAACPVRRDCLQVALNDPRPDKDTHAVIGGTLPGQRAMLRKALTELRETDGAAKADREPAFAA